VRFPRPTALGIKGALFYALLLAAFFAARYSNLFFLLIAFLTVLAVYGLLATHRNLRGVRGRIERIEPTPAGAGAPLAAVLETGRRPRVGVVLELDVEGRGPIALPAGVVRRRTPVAQRLPALPRGLYPIRRATLASTWPFGLFRARVPLEAPARVVVYPAPLETDARGRGVGPGDLFDGSTADGFLQPSSLREYRPGDELRRVHWKASARRLGLVVQEWEGGTGSGLEVVLDRRAEPGAFERALSTLSGLAQALREQKESLTLHAQDQSATFGGSHRPWDELLAYLAGVQPLPQSAPPPPPAPAHVPRIPAVRSLTQIDKHPGAEA